MNQNLPPNQKTRLGILGGGQLALMLARNCPSTMIKLSVLCADHNDPASRGPWSVTVNPSDSDSILKAWLETQDIIVFENEFLDIERIKKLQSAHNYFVPSLEALKPLQDKWIQKTLFQTLNLKTAQALLISNIDQIPTQPGLLKWSRMGYDGKGVFWVQKNSLKAAQEFIATGINRGAQIYWEALVPFEKELAMVAVFHHDQAQFFPLVESQQSQGICHIVRGPALEFGVGKDVEIQAQDSLKKVSSHLKYQGVLAMEFFWSPQHGLMINEVAPRVHNSGHYSLDSCEPNQFSIHMDAALGHDLKKINIKQKTFAMYNLVAGPDVTPGPAQAPINFPSNWNLHWYNKTQIRPLRKMGHINITSPDSVSLNQELQKIKSQLTNWL